MDAKRYRYVGAEDKKETHLRIVRDFERLKAGPGLVKDDVKSTVVRAECDGEEVYCKRFNNGGFFGFVKNQLRRSKALRSYRNAELADERGIPTVRHLAAVEEKGALFLSASYLITKSMTNALPVQTYIKSRFPGEADAEAKKKGFARQFAAFVATVHSRGLLHGDLKGTNVLVREKSDGEWEFRVLDLDDVSFTDEVPMKTRIRNLVQLNNDCMHVCGERDRLRFLAHYFDEAGLELLREDKREIAGEIATLTAEKVKRWHREGEKLMRRGKVRHRDDSMRID